LRLVFALFSWTVH